MSEKKRKIIQTFMLLVLSSSEIAIIFLSYIGILHNTEIAIYMVNVTLMFMVIVQLFWLQNFNGIAFITCHIYFVVMCILLYYSINIIDVIIFIINILVLLDTTIIRGRSIKNNK